MNDEERERQREGLRVWGPVDYYCLRHLRVAVGIISHSVRNSVLLSCGETTLYFMYLHDFPPDDCHAAMRNRFPALGPTISQVGHVKFVLA